jgi:hypothetical protein
MEGSDELVLGSPAAESALLERVAGLLREWDRAGRPTDADLTIKAYERGRAPPRAPGEVAVEQRWATFVLRWAPSR